MVKEFGWRSGELGWDAEPQREEHIERELNGVVIGMARFDQEQEAVDGDDNEDEETEKWSSTPGSYV